MLTNYFTLRALAGEWNALLNGSSFEEAYSAHRGELTLVFQSAGEFISLRVGTVRPLQYAFAYPGHNRPKRNAASFFSSAEGLVVTGVECEHLDRVVRIQLTGGWSLVIPLFGAKANVLLVNDEGQVVDAFRASTIGDKLAPARPVRIPDNASGFESVASAEEQQREKALRQAIPILDRDLARELLHRAEYSADARALYSAWKSLEADLKDPAPRIAEAEGVERFSLIPLAHADEIETFDEVNSGVRTFVRRRLSKQAFESRYRPVLGLVKRAAETARRRVEAMEQELSKPSRADEYERYGHLLMADVNLPITADSVEVEDLFDGGRIEIPVDPRLTAIENAQSYYDRARRVRAARHSAADRFDVAIEEADLWQRRLETVLGIGTTDDLKQFEAEEASALAILKSSSGSGESVPYRTIRIGAHDVLIGKSAADNDRLTFGHARKHDLWLHARGVSGSHVVIRTERGQQVDRSVINRAASLAAWYSKARTSGLVPVIVTERKFVRKPRGAHPGAVLVDRESVLTVEPLHPDKI
jgi:predicted ribosome quality control (RQC) complex YloA/Tae2 family protein